MMWDIVNHLADVLLACEDGCVDRDPLTDEWPELDLQTAYAVQDEVLRRKLADGQSVVGVKLGLTSRAKQQRMNVHAPLTGWLTDAMVLPAGVPVPQGELIHPRAEPAIVFVMAARALLSLASASRRSAKTCGLFGSAVTTSDHAKCGAILADQSMGGLRWPDGITSIRRGTTCCRRDGTAGVALEARLCQRSRKQQA